MSNTTDVNDAMAHAAPSSALTTLKAAYVDAMNAVDTGLDGLGASQKAVQIPDVKQGLLESATKAANALKEG